MSWFRRRKRQNDRQGEKHPLTRKIINALNYTPVDYFHSEKFRRDGQDPVRDVRRKLADIHPDDLNDDMLDPSIDADTADEIAFGEVQRLHHIDTIRQLTDSAKEEAVKVYYQKRLLTEDRERLVAERDRLIALRNSL